MQRLQPFKMSELYLNRWLPRLDRLYSRYLVLGGWVRVRHQVSTSSRRCMSIHISTINYFCKDLLLLSASLTSSLLHGSLDVGGGGVVLLLGVTGELVHLKLARAGEGGVWLAKSPLRLLRLVRLSHTIWQRRPLRLHRSPCLMRG